MPCEDEKHIYFQFSHKRQVFLHDKTKMAFKRQIQAVKGKVVKRKV